MQGCSLSIQEDLLDSCAEDQTIVYKMHWDHRSTFWMRRSIVCNKNISSNHLLKWVENHLHVFESTYTFLETLVYNDFGLSELRVVQKSAMFELYFKRNCATWQKSRDSSCEVNCNLHIINELWSSSNALCK
jgi:hypothetical protein